MSRIDAGRVLVGGLIAGVVVNVGEFILNMPVLGDDWTAALAALGKPEMGANSAAMIGFLAGGFLTGLAALWLYAAIRPRYGAGPNTAIRAGAAVWFLLYLLPNFYIALMDILPNNLLAISTLWGMIEIPLATVIGARFYQEAAAEAAAPAQQVITGV